MGKQPTRNILVTFDISSIAGRDQLSGVLKYLHTRPDWIPRLVSRPADFTPEIVHNAKREMIDGIIINHAGSPETEEELVQSDIPLAVIGIRNPKLLARTQSIAFIRNDNIETGRVAARYFRSLGNFRSFGYIPASQTGEEWSLSRAEGFRAELAAAEAEVSVFTCAANVGTEVSRRELAVWLKALPKPAAVLAAWDYPAIQALEICRAESIKVPHDIAVLGVDNDPLLCESTVPALSSIHTGGYRRGQIAAEMLDALMHGRRPARRAVALPPLSVVTRGSTGYDAMKNPAIARAVTFIRSHAATGGVSVPAVARAAGCSRSYLDKHFRSGLGLSVREAVLRERIERVKTLVSSTNRTMTEIAADCGFARDSHLARLFKETTGLTMRQWRRENHETPDE